MRSHVKFLSLLWIFPKERDSFPLKNHGLQKKHTNTPSYRPFFMARIAWLFATTFWSVKYIVAVWHGVIGSILQRQLMLYAIFSSAQAWIFTAFPYHSNLFLSSFFFSSRMLDSKQRHTFVSIYFLERYSVIEFEDKLLLQIIHVWNISASEVMKYS